MGKFIGLNGKVFGGKPSSACQQKFNDSHCNLSAKTTQEAIDSLYDLIKNTVVSTENMEVYETVLGATDEEIDGIIDSIVNDDTEVTNS